MTVTFSRQSNWGRRGFPYPCCLSGCSLARWKRLISAASNEHLSPVTWRNLRGGENGIILPCHPIFSTFEVCYLDSVGKQQELKNTMLWGPTMFFLIPFFPQGHLRILTYRNWLICLHASPMHGIFVMQILVYGCIGCLIYFLISSFERPLLLYFLLVFSIAVKSCACEWELSSQWEYTTTCATDILERGQLGALL